MSEVKLYVHTSTIVYDKFFQQEMESVGLRPATTAEIMEAHPKCGECRHSDTNKHYNTTDCIVDRRFIRVVNKDKDYCRHWEAKQ